MYALVTLKTSGEIMVVAKNWLTADKKQTYWRPFKSSEKVTAAVRMRSSPQIQGNLRERIDITFRGEFATYDDALKSQEVLQSIAVQKMASVASGEPHEKRRKLNTGIVSNFTKMIPQTSQSSLTTRIVRTDKLYVKSPSKTNEQSKIIKMLREINKQVQANSKMLNELLKRVDRPGQPCSTSRLPETFRPKLPLTSLGEVKMIEQELRDQKTRQNYIQYLSGLGGFGPKEIIRGIMQAVMTDELAMSFNWQGRQNKNPISALALTKIIKAAGMRCGVNNALSEKEIKNWLRYASECNARMKMKDLKDPEAGTSPVTSVTPSDACDFMAGQAFHYSHLIQQNLEFK
ncbi:uncharacterized protein [Hoplias malabaricus]|uniref:uncharacterized protein n=1 Tax=Hoplias malabaricus TaxID=27720 RepID=UPI0034625302